MTQAVDWIEPEEEPNTERNPCALHDCVYRDNVDALLRRQEELEDHIRRQKNTIESLMAALRESEQERRSAERLARQQWGNPYGGRE